MKDGRPHCLLSLFGRLGGYMVESKTVAAPLPPLRGRRACYRVQIPRMMRLWFIVRADKGNAWTWRVCEGVCISRGEGRGGKRLTRMSTDLFLLPAKASWESKRSNRHRTSIYETRLRNEISSGEEGEILFFFFLLPSTYPTDNTIYLFFLEKDFKL